MARALEWAGLVWLVSWIAVPAMLLGSWIADQLDRCTGHRKQRA